MGTYFEGPFSGLAYVENPGTCDILAYHPPVFVPWYPSILGGFPSTWLFRVRWRVRKPGSLFLSISCLISRGWCQIECSLCERIRPAGLLGLEFRIPARYNSQLTGKKDDDVLSTNTKSFYAKDRPFSKSKLRSHSILCSSCGFAAQNWLFWFWMGHTSCSDSLA